jgi:biopolymer transport protein ExbD
MQAGDSKSYDDINVTPMVDLYLVLLLIFIIMTTAGVQSIKVNLPKAGGPTKKTEGNKTQAITINPEGKIFLNTIPVTIADLEQKLTQLKAKTPEFPVVVKGDGRMQYQGIMEVLDVLGRVGVSNIGLATEAPKK